MQIVDNIVILLIVVLAFWAGKHISDSYQQRQIQELEFQLRLYSAEKGVGYVAPPARKRMPIGQSFMDRLKENKRATQQINP